MIEQEWPLTEQVWQKLVDHVLPSGAFLIVDVEARKSVATAVAVHNPRASRYYFPFGGELGYVFVDPNHRGKRLGEAVSALVVERLLKAGYRHIFVGVQGWRIPAIKSYLRLGFVPLLHDERLLPRWSRICEQIGWRSDTQTWPRSLTDFGQHDVNAE
jgi:mycothiol synthase